MSLYLWLKINREREANRGVSRTPTNEFERRERIRTSRELSRKFSL